MKSLLFIGHSVLALFPEDSLGDYRIHNLAKQGTIAKEGWRMVEKEAITFRDYDGLVLMYGVNELYFRFNKSLIGDYVEKILAEVRQQAPNLAVILVPVMPAESGPRYHMEDIDQVNQDLKTISQTYQCHWFSWDPFLDEEGQVEGDLTFDRIHLTPAGYTVFGDQLQALLEKSFI